MLTSFLMAVAFCFNPEVPPMTKRDILISILMFLVLAAADFYQLVE